LRKVKRILSKAKQTTDSNKEEQGHDGETSRATIFEASPTDGAASAPNWLGEREPQCRERFLVLRFDLERIQTNALGLAGLVQLVRFARARSACLFTRDVFARLKASRSGVAKNGSRHQPLVRHQPSAID
jgi:hypothetical protein